jgi:hypothetical protein
VDASHEGVKDITVVDQEGYPNSCFIRCMDFKHCMVIYIW